MDKHSLFWRKQRIGFGKVGNVPQKRIYYLLRKQKKNEVKKMKIIEILAIVMSECKKVYGEQFESLSSDAKKAVIMQFISEIMAKNSYLKVCIGEAFYNELVGA